MTDELIDSRSRVAAGLARRPAAVDGGRGRSIGHGAGIETSRIGALASHSALASVALVGDGHQPAAPASPAPAACGSAAPLDAAPGASRRRRLHRPAGDDRILHLGRPDGARQPAGHRRRLPRRQPEHHGQCRRCPTGSLLGQAPDRPRRRRRAGRLRHGRPALPRLPAAGRAAGPDAAHRPRTATTSTALADDARRRLHDARRRGSACRAT